MKSAYELAMERLAKESPVDSITEEQKVAIAEVDKKYSSKIAEREVFLKSSRGARLKSHLRGRGRALDGLGELRRLALGPDRAWIGSDE